MTRSLLALSSSFLALALSPGLAAQELPRAQSDDVRAHVEFLADDLLEGRQSGTRGYDLAALYVASRFEAMGLEPGGTDGSWYQDVPFVRALPGTTQASVEVGGETVALDDSGFALVPSVASETIDVDAELVLVGRGLSEPLLGVDDYAGIDMTDKIAVVLPGTPAGLPGDVNAHVASTKVAAAAAAGAVGIITVMGVDGERAGGFLNYMRTHEKVDVVGPDGRPGKMGGLQFQAYVTPSMASRMLGVDLGAVVMPYAMGQTVDLPQPADARLRLTATSTHETFTAPNVIARLEGGDAALRDEHVMLTAHLDHVGVQEDAPGEDKIFNGALDNAAGIATMLEAARLFTEDSQAPARSVTFIALAAEEMGLLGAAYYADNPTVPIEEIVGVVNLDMPVPLYDFNDVVAFGASYNSVAEKVAAAGSDLGISVSPDPMPEQNIFVRSDHYEFAKKGVPAILLFTGYGNGGEAVWEDFFANRYHKAGDDLSQPFDWSALAKYADLNYRIARTIADDAERPMWYDGTYFGNRFAPGARRAAAPAGLDSAGASD